MLEACNPTEAGMFIGRERLIIGEQVLLSIFLPFYDLKSLWSLKSIHPQQTPQRTLVSGSLFDCYALCALLIMLVCGEQIAEFCFTTLGCP